jgi:UDP-glucose 4-epimerase
MATILITGGAGFLGSHLADYYAEKGDRVIIVDHHRREKVRFLPKSAEVHALDFTDPHVREVIMEVRPDVVFHLAAQISVTKSVIFPIEDAKRNVLASIRLLEWCKDAGIGKFVFASSGGAIYGDNPMLPTPLIEDAQPLSPYGIGKQAFEYYLASAKRTHDLPWVSVRFANLYGSRQQVAKPIGEGNVISLFLEKLLVTGEPFTVFGDGSASRDYLHVSDAVAILVKAAASPFSGIVNAGTGSEITIQELIDALLKIHGTDHPFLFAPERRGEVRRSSIDPASAKAVLAWEARVTFEDGLKETYAWYKTTFGR